MKSLYDANYSEEMFFLFPWKAYDISEQLQELTARLSASTQVCLMALPFSYIQPLSQQIELPNLYLGADDMLSEEQGSFTENLAAPMLKKAGASFVMIGSAASRRLFGDNDESINHKLLKAHDAHLTPLLCIGETIAQKQEDQGAEVVAKQLEIGLRGLTPEQIAHTIIVVEMPWLAKSDEPMTEERLAELYNAYDQLIKNCVGDELFQKMHILYAFNDEIEDKANLVRDNAKQGFYAPQCKLLLSMLDSIASSPHMAAITARRPVKHVVPEQVLPFEKQEPLSFEAETGKIKTIETEEEAAQKEQKEKEVEKEEAKAATAMQEAGEGLPLETVSSTQESASESTSLQPSAAQAATTAAESSSTEQTAETEAGALGAPAMASEVSAAATSEATSAPPSVIPTKTTTRAEELIPAMDAELAEEKLEEALQMSALSTAEEFAIAEPEALSIEALNTKVAQMSQCNKVLEECYDHIKLEAERLFALRKEFPPLMVALSEELNKIDPQLQAYINSGNFEYFLQNPDKAQEAKAALLCMDKSNTMIQEVAAIPKHIDHFTEKGRQLREQLSNDWTFFVTHRKEIEQILPDFTLPALPSQLAAPEPNIDLSLPVLPLGQSPLAKKHVGLVNL